MEGRIGKIRPINVKQHLKSIWEILVPSIFFQMLYPSNP